MTDRVERRACERLREALEAYVDGEVETGRRERIDRHLEGCPGCREELALAIEVRDGLRRLPSREAPRAAVVRVLEIARAEAPPRPAAWARQWLAGLRLQPALATLAAVALMVALAWFLFPAPAPESRVSAEDPAVVRATLETKLALAHLARVNRKIGLGLGDDVLSERVVAPARRGVARSLASPEEGDAPAGGGSNERG